MCQIRTGKLNANAQEADGLYPFFTCDAKPYRINTYAFDTSAILISGNGSQVGHLNLYEGKFNAYQRTYVLYDFKHAIKKFVYYYVSAYMKPYITRNCKKGSVPYITLPMLQEFEIPVPPIEVQQEFVHILDKFTELEAELQAELDARKMQYEYYREKLILDAKNVEIKTIEEIATNIYRGAGIKRDETTPTGIPCVRYGEIYTSYNISFNKCVSFTEEDVVASPKYFEYGDILFAITGESIEDIAKSVAYLGHDKCMCGGDIVVMKHTQEPRYISYALSTYDAIVQKGKGKVKSKVVHSSVPAIQKIRIPVPPMDEQVRIADKLDAFLTLIYNENNGLLAEIEARHKQYEYYRDILLTFERKVV